MAEWLVGLTPSISAAPGMRDKQVGMKLNICLSFNAHLFVGKSCRRMRPRHWNVIFSSALYLGNDSDPNKGISGYRSTMLLLVSWMEEEDTTKFFEGLRCRGLVLEFVYCIPASGAKVPKLMQLVNNGDRFVCVQGHSSFSTTGGMRRRN